MTTAYDDSGPWSAVFEADDDAARQQALLAWTRLSAPRVVGHILERCLASPRTQRPVHDAVAFAVLSGVRPRRLPSIDATLRGRTASRSVEFDGFGAGPLGLLSMQRDGYVRQAATEALRDLDGPLVLRLLLLRCNDVVEPVAEVARDAVESRLHGLDDIVAALPLLHAMRSMVRAANTGFPDRVESELLSGHAKARSALQRSLDAPDPDLRRHGLRLLLRIPAEAPDAMRAGLADADPVVRLETARWVSGKHADAELQSAALPFLIENASPTVRMLGLQVARRLEATEPIREAVFDATAPVRHRARRYASKLGLSLDVRAEALARLSTAATCLGALATLSDVGRSEDHAVIEPFAEHPRRSIAREARRTLERLGDPTCRP